MTQRTYRVEIAWTIRPELLESTRHGSSIVITVRGKPYAALVPVQTRRNRSAILKLRSTGAGLWGTDPARTIAKKRNEWE